MENKGQITVGAIVLMAMAVIVGLVLFQSSAQEVSKSLPDLVTQRNLTVTWGAQNSIQEITGQELVGTPLVTNRTNNGVTINAANYSVYECVRTSDGYKGICLKTIGDATKDINMGTSSNISYQYYPAGYIDDAGGRGIAGIIVLLAAVAIALVVLAGIKWEWF